VRDRVEADVTVCTRMGLSPLSITVLRCAEILAPDMGSQLHDYLSSRVCLRPFGFDPMLNLLTLEDTVRALVLALGTEATGIFNIPGADTLPLRRAIALWGRSGIALPGPLLAPLYAVRASALGMEFRYDMNHRRFHFSAILDGRRARNVLGYAPEHPIAWPVSAARKGAAA
jgi:UDP-glucose 4-epimerase